MFVVSISILNRKYQHTQSKVSAYFVGSVSKAMEWDLILLFDPINILLWMPESTKAKHNP